MATSTPLLPPDRRVGDPAAAAPVPRAAPGRFRLSYLSVATLTFITALFLASARNMWGCHAWIAYSCCSYLIFVVHIIAIQCAFRFPPGSAAAARAWRVMCFSRAGILTACLFQVYFM